MRFVFLADNPGRWFFRCHNLYHLKTGMAREFIYNSAIVFQLTATRACQVIDASAFGHVDHVGVELLRRYDFLNASVKYSECINTIATMAGAAEKFNTTITLAFLSLIAERMQLTRHETFDDFIQQNQDLLSSNLLAKWYSRERLQSDLARIIFLMPDVAA